MNRRYRLGTRGSPLALAQAREAKARIIAANEMVDDAIEIVPIATTGDKVQDRPLSEIGGKSLWTKELDRALIERKIDFAVHSMKDVESERPAGFIVAATLRRADVRDRLIGADSIASIPPGAVVGTSSPRRSAQLQRLRPDLRVIPLRGNVQTRLSKIADGEVAATLLAAAGLDRLGIEVGVPMAIAQFLPAPGQAAVGIECRVSDPEVGLLVGRASHGETHLCVAAERAFTAALGGSCHSPIAALAGYTEGVITLNVALYSADGTEMVEDAATFPAGNIRIAEAMGRDLIGRAPASIRRLFEGD